MSPACPFLPEIIPLHQLKLLKDIVMYKTNKNADMALRNSTYSLFCNKKEEINIYQL
jgi:hypothetical protein